MLKTRNTYAARSGRQCATILWRWAVIDLALLIGCVASAIVLCQQKDQVRRCVGELTQLREARAAIDDEYGRLLLEAATYASLPRVEATAREHLRMYSLPAPRLVRGARTTPHWGHLVWRAPRVIPSAVISP